LLKTCIYPIQLFDRGVAQPGSASGLGPEGRRFKSCRPDHLNMKKAKIYKPTKTAMQSGNRNSKHWILEFDTINTGIDPLMGWETSRDTMSEVKLKFTSKDQAVTYAKKNNIEYYIVEPQKRKLIKKTYADNFLK
tara:strand:- start:118 stop:522 length:405 start_codon:yes stop_codon:yes gene_type:complete